VENSKILIAVVVIVILGGGFLVMRSGKSSGTVSETGTGGTSKSASKLKGSKKLPTALEAWEKIKPEADKWSSNYKIARISDIDTPSYQRIDGVSLGWKFYLEECDEYFTGSMSDQCKEGKTRSFYYQAEDIVGRDAGVSADAETEMTSGRTAFSVDDFKIDSDSAQEAARVAVGRGRNDDEEFEMEAVVIDGSPYWKVGRQCWTRGDRDKCDSQNGYSAYVDLKTGEAQSEKP